MTARGTINRLGRIGRATSKILHEAPEFELVAQLWYDTVKGRHPEEGPAKGGGLKVGDRTCRFRNDTDVAEVNAVLDEEVARRDRDSVVSPGIIREPYGALVDLSLTQVVGESPVKNMARDEDEWGFAVQLVRAAPRRNRRVNARS